MSLKTIALPVLLASIFGSPCAFAEHKEAALRVEVSGGGTASGTPKSAPASFGFAPAVGLGIGLSIGVTEQLSFGLSVNQNAAFGLVVAEATVPIPGSGFGETLNGALQTDLFTSSARLSGDFALDLVVEFWDLVASDVFVGVFAGPALGIFNHQYLLNPADLSGALLLPGQIEPDVVFGGLGGVAVGVRLRMFSIFIVDSELRASAGYVGSPTANVALVIRPAVSFYPLSLF